MNSSLFAGPELRRRAVVVMLLASCVVVPAYGQRRVFRGYSPPPRSAPTGRAEPAAAGPIRTAAPAFRADQAGSSKYALVIALREYPQASQLDSLPGTDRDALRLVGALRNGGYPEQNIVLVYDDAEDDKLRPTRANILAALTAILGRAPAGSSVAVFATGHGVALNKASYLCPSDATDAALGDPAKAAEQLIAIEEIATQMSKRCKAEHKLLVIDACRDTNNDRTKDYVVNVADLEQPAEGVWLMSSCSNGQFSWMSDGIRQGERHALFSHFVTEGLEGAADLLGDNDGRVGLFELYTYAFVKTRTAAQEIGKAQTPELFGLAGPFTLATTGSFVARRTLTTSDPESEARRSALQLADDVVLDLRAADAEYRGVAAGEKATLASVRDASLVLHQYLCHLLGNRIAASLEFDPDCKLAHVAQGLCYRTCGMYEQALDGFLKGGETLDLFVKAKPGMKKAYVAHDESGGMLQYRNNDPVPSIEGSEKREKPGEVSLFARPNDENPQQQVPRQSMVRITKIDGQWLFVSAVNDVPLDEGGWISREEVHWFPEAVDLYTPSSPMRPWSSGSGVSRLDYAANGLNGLAERLALPAARIDMAAVPFETVAGRLYRAADIVSRPTTQINNATGWLRRFGVPVPVVPNPVADVLGQAGNYAGTPAAVLHDIAGKARIPANYVAIAGGYAQVAANYAHMAQFWSGAANEYYDGNERSQKLDKDRKELDASGDLKPVKERPLPLFHDRTPWGSRKAGPAGGANQP